MSALEWIQNGLAVAAVLSGIFFLLVASIGLIRFPDFYSRAHAIAKSDMLGIMLVLLGMAIYQGFSLNTVKILLTMLFIGMANPIGTHALAKSAWDYGLRPWFVDSGRSGGAEKEKGA